MVMPPPQRFPFGRDNLKNILVKPFKFAMWDGQCHKRYCFVTLTFNFKVTGDLLKFRFWPFYPTALKGCWGIVFTHGVRMGGWVAGKSLPSLHLRNRKV